MPSCRYIIRGHVQGVGYRFFAVREARRLGISGYTRNLPDGSVEVVAVADTQTLRAFEARLNEGPTAAIVSVVESSRTTVGNFEGFTIR
jgi:acylphosphatase